MDKFLIAPINSGLDKSHAKFLIPEDAYQQMNNALVWRGRVKKRFGSTYTGNPAVANNSRLRINLGNTTMGGNFVINIEGISALEGSTYAVGQQFTVGSDTYTVVVDNGNMLATNGSGTFDIETGTGTINGALAGAGIPVYWYPSLPVMGLCQYEVGPVNNQPAIAFDTDHPYQYNGSSWELMEGSTTTPLFQGDNLDYFWATNWDGATESDTNLFVTNYNATVPVPAATDDPIWRWDGDDWEFYRPIFLGNGSYVATARIILPFKNRLILLSTIEVDNDNPMSLVSAEYPQRCRFSHLGSPLAFGAWLEPNQVLISPGPVNASGAGYVDAATKERIISAEFIKDRLIVYFETSTYELVYTNSQVLPFVWQKINTELGAVGTLSSVPFDKAVLGVGKTGVHACSGANVERIDQKIPDEIFDFKVDDSAYNRITGIRDYQPELVYWSYVKGNARSTQEFSTNVMVYNYQNQTWSFNTDCIMVWGYFEQQSDLTWADATMTWAEANFDWLSNVVPAKSRQVIFGNQQGWICIVRQDISRNAANMQITNIEQISSGIWEVTIINHNLTVSDPNNDWILLQFDESDDYNSNIAINPLSDGIFKIFSVENKDTIRIATIIPNTTIDALSYIDEDFDYLGKGTAARVSRIDIVSKQWNPYINQGKDVYLSKIVFGVLSTSLGEIQVDYMTDDSPLNMVSESDGSGTGVILGSNILETYPYLGYDTLGTARVWHPVYFQGQGNCVQIRIYYSDIQMGLSRASLEDFTLEGLILHTISASMRFS